jgi:hypothetical protein
VSKYQAFIYEDWQFDAASKLLTLHYAYDDALHFTETYHFDFPFVQYDETALNQAFQNLFIMAGVSYYKMYLAPQIEIRKGSLNQNEASFFATTYQQGLGEFFYVNKMNPRALINFPVSDTATTPPLKTTSEGLLIGIGGGKDSLLSIELLRRQPHVATWSLNHRSQFEPLVQRIGLPHLWVERAWDPQIGELNTQDAYNGHVPISAIFATTGTVVAILGGYRDVVVSNESSANEPTLNFQGTAINHQYSKSLPYERNYQALLQAQFAGSQRYYSFLRPLSELRITELFTRIGFAKYYDVFSSCNRAFVHTSNRMFWCGECPKCAFVFLAFTSFIDRSVLEQLWGGKNLLLDPALDETYKQLLGISGDKPLECIGAIQESRAAMRHAQTLYPELQKYEFDLSEDYDYRSLAPHAMPEEIYRILYAAAV